MSNGPYNGHCSNCNGKNHDYRNCRSPITSYGIILMDIPQVYRKEFIDYIGSINRIPEMVGVKCADMNDINKFCNYKDKIKFLMIQRKHSLGFTEFIRGKYILENVEGIVLLFSQMRYDEIEAINNKNFDALWNRLWGYGDYKNRFRREYELSKKKFYKLVRCDDCTHMNLDFFVNNIKPIWNHTEWGFPKGRRNRKESNYLCAVREFKEESGFNDDEFIMFHNLGSIVENLVGTNDINYRHVYYFGINNTDRKPTVDPENSIQNNEIGDVMWLSFDNAMKIIRTHHKERKYIVTKLFSFVLDYIIKH